MSKGKGMSMTDFDRDQLDSAYHKPVQYVSANHLLARHV